MRQPGLRICITLMRIRTHLFTEMCIRIQLFNLMRIRIRILVKVMLICGHWSTDLPGLHFEPIRRHCKRPRPSTATFLEPLNLLNFAFNADPDLDLAFHSNADPDSASKNNADPDPQCCCQLYCDLVSLVEPLEVETSENCFHCSFFPFFSKLCYPNFYVSLGDVQRVPKGRIRLLHGHDACSSQLCHRRHQGNLPETLGNSDIIHR
jgi:hypothetical protein